MAGYYGCFHATSISSIIDLRRFPAATYFRNSASSRSKPLLRIGKRHQVLGSRFSSSRWNDGAYRSRFHWLRHHRRKNRSTQAASCCASYKRELRSDGFEDFDRQQLVADRRPLDGVEHAVGHQVAFVGLVGGRRPQLGGRPQLVTTASAGSGPMPAGPVVSIHLSQSSRNALSMPAMGARPPQVSPSIVA